ncbi:VOC family protein [Nocardioides sp. zg-579]|uniref:VOC family protein n=1 Tax=Nocardioides marmotae TaxID=2663857 RepID=A0A6I3JAD2_9ACTN|nr:VOC family protein [Nocardioides marmotae]MCR6030381.1 VOC family protein [Gordonia jinghuaiqii]MTB94015.1 VOC family protein [Nocardioides marmotae]QKE00325.1 VOC family protein [Nocardioides marmotae]
MPVQLSPYLHFDGTTREAMSFYHSVLGGDLTVDTFADHGMDGPGSDGVMHSMLRTEDGLMFMASDLPPGTTLSPGDATVSITLSGDDEARLSGWFHALAEGGEVHVPLEKQMWGDLFGQLKDRYGVQWMVDVG